jgi:hypothetical protein
MACSEKDEHKQLYRRRTRKIRKEFGQQLATQEMQDAGGRDAKIISIDTTIWIQEAFAEATKLNAAGKDVVHYGAITNTEVIERMSSRY